MNGLQALLVTILIALTWTPVQAADVECRTTSIEGNVIWEASDVSADAQARLRWGYKFHYTDEHDREPYARIYTETVGGDFQLKSAKVLVDGAKVESFRIKKTTGIYGDVYVSMHANTKKLGKAFSKGKEAVIIASDGKQEYKAKFAIADLHNALMKARTEKARLRELEQHRKCISADPGGYSPF